MKLNKKLASIGLVTAMVASMGVTGVSAANSSDSLFSFIFSKSQNVTEFRLKEDNSPAYMICYSATAPYDASVYVGTAESGAVKKSSDYYFTTGTEKLLSLNGSRSPGEGCVILGEANYWDAAAWGYWSPDSV